MDLDNRHKLFVLGAFLAVSFDVNSLAAAVQQLTCQQNRLVDENGRNVHRAAIPWFEICSKQILSGKSTPVVLHTSFGADAFAMCQQVRHFCKLLEDTFLCLMNLPNYI